MALEWLTWAFRWFGETLKRLIPRKKSASRTRPSAPGSDPGRDSGTPDPTHISGVGIEAKEPGASSPEARATGNHPKTKDQEEAAPDPPVENTSADPGRNACEDERNRGAPEAGTGSVRTEATRPPAQEPRAATRADNEQAVSPPEGPAGEPEEAGFSDTERARTPLEGAAGPGPPSNASGVPAGRKKPAPARSSAGHFAPASPTRRKPEGPRKPREPWRFGARRYYEGSPHQNDHSDHPPPPELRCRRLPGLEWAIYLTVPFDLDVTSVRFGGKDLTEENGEYRVPRFRGAITLAGDDDERRDIPLYDSQKPLVFRLSGSGDSSSGRQCRKITSGRFLVFAPVEPKLTIPSFREPEACSDRGFLAHHVAASMSDTPESLGSIGNWRLGADRSASLTGKRVVDSSDEGELFIDEPPRLASTDGIEWARVGDERPAGWKGENFLAKVQPLGEVLGGRRGRFFLRTYQPGSILLVDNTAFRYWPDLREIQVNGEQFSGDLVLIPPPGGHGKAAVRLLGRGGPLPLEVLSEHAQSNRGSVLVPPTPDDDEVLLRLCDGEDQLNLVVNLPRVWWRLSEADRWTDRPIPMQRSDFRTSNERLEVLVPCSIKSLKVGLGKADEGALSFQVSYAKDFASKKQAEIPLEDFADFEALTKDVADELSLWLRFSEGEATAIRVLPGPVERAAASPTAPATGVMVAEDGGNAPLTLTVADALQSGRPVGCQGSRSAPKIGQASGIRSVRGVAIDRLLAGARRAGVRMVISGNWKPINIPLNGSTIANPGTGIFHRTKVVLQPASEGTGVSARSPVKQVLEAAGIQDVRTALYGPLDHWKLGAAAIHALRDLAGAGGSKSTLILQKRKESRKARKRRLRRLSD